MLNWVATTLDEAAGMSASSVQLVHVHYASLLIRTEMEARFKLRVYSETHRDL